ncbi:MAG TPA: hypothetical protein VEY07_06425 [Thermoplasmata archaeon]|nr:hypothetical protein [Thermoplasmata archaeon]
MTTTSTRSIATPGWTMVVAFFAVIGVLGLPSIAGVPASTLLSPHASAASGGPDTGAAGMLRSAVASLEAGLGPARGEPVTCPTPTVFSTTRCSAAAAPVPHGASPSGWSELGTTPSTGGWLAYDSADGYALYLGPGDSLGGSYSTWVYRSGSWSQFTGSGPGSCSNGAMAYDPADKQVVFVGGANCTSQGETWGYAGGLWTLHGSGAPIRAYSTLVSDPRDGYLLSFGGFNQSCGPCNYTWTYSGGTWTNISSTAGHAPSSRYEAVAAFDPTDSEVVLFGGARMFSSGYLNDTWTFSGGTWTDLGNGSAPAPRFAASAGPAPSGGGILLFGGTDNVRSAGFGDTWRFVGGSWTRLTSAGGPTGGNWQMALLSGGSPQALLVGATESASGVPSSFSQTWTFSTGSWVNATALPPPVLEAWAPSLTYDAADGYVLLYGLIEHSSGGIQYFSTITWSYAAGQWQNLSPVIQPSPRWNAGLAYDAQDGYVVLFGGTGWLYDAATCGSTTVAHNLCGDTWEFAHGAWKQITPTGATPSNRTVGAALVYDGADGYVLLAGGTCYGSRAGETACNDTWTFSAGNWTNLTSTAGASPAGYGITGAAYDAADSYVLVTAFDPAAYPRALTYSFLGGHWTNRTGSSGTAPPAGPIAYDAADSQVLLFYAVSGGLASVPYDTSWAYSGGSWTNLTASPTPPVFGGSVVNDAVDGYVLLFGMGPSSYPPSPPSASGLNLYFAWGPVAPAGLTVTSFVASHSSTDVGVAVTLSTTASGGSSPYGFVYSGLPTGCTSSNTSALLCTPTSTGTFTVTVLVTDSAGARASASLSLQVAVAPTVTGFTVAPASAILGHRVFFTTNVSGGVPPWSYTYSGLPPGCGTQSVPILPCTPVTAGNYTVVVRVQDAVGASGTATLALAVAAAGGSGAPVVSSFQALPAAIVLGNSTNLTVVASGTAPLTYAYSGLPAGCASSNVSALGCRPTSAGTYTITAVVLDAAFASTSVETNLTVFPVGGGAGLQVSAFSASPSTIPVGTSTTVQAIASGGTGPLGFSYAGLPAGCASQNSSSFPCVPTVPGSYALSVTVFDSAGHRTGTRTTVEVVASVASILPQLEGLVASPNVLAPGDNLTVVALIAGGTPPLSFVYSGLPGGCTGANASIVTCRPTETGTFTLSVRVTDPFGHEVSASTGLTVAVRPPGGPSVNPAGSEFTTPIALALEFLAGAAVVAAILGSLERRRRRQQGQAFVRDLGREAARTEPIDDGE